MFVWRCIQMNLTSNKSIKFIKSNFTTDIVIFAWFYQHCLTGIPKHKTYYKSAHGMFTDNKRQLNKIILFDVTGLPIRMLKENWPLALERLRHQCQTNDFWNYFCPENICFDCLLCIYLIRNIKKYFSKVFLKALSSRCSNGKKWKKY